MFSLLSKLSLSFLLSFLLFLFMSLCLSLSRSLHVSLFECVLVAAPPFLTRICARTTSNWIGLGSPSRTFLNDINARIYDYVWFVDVCGDRGQADSVFMLRV